jgi:hypothetical protein
MRELCKHHGLNYLVQAIAKVLPYPKPFLRYIKNHLGSITYLKNPKRVLHNPNKT